MEDIWFFFFNKGILDILIGFPSQCLGFPNGSDGKESTCNAGDPGLIPGLGRSLEKGMAIQSSVLTWRIPWTEEPGGLQPRWVTKSRT